MCNNFKCTLSRKLMILCILVAVTKIGCLILFYYTDLAVTKACGLILLFNDLKYSKSNI